MFLTRGEIHQEPLWALWFQHLAGLVPVSALRVSQHATVTTMPGVLRQHVSIVPRAHDDNMVSSVYKMLGIVPSVSISNAALLPDPSCIHHEHWDRISMTAQTCADT